MKIDLARFKTLILNVIGNLGILLLILSSSSPSSSPLPVRSALWETFEDMLPSLAPEMHDLPHI